MTKDSLAIYQSISNDIITMKLKPGDMLKEIEVANKFNVSRTPIRDVFKRLEYDKLLDIHSQKGSFVSKINLEGITDMMYVRTQVEISVITELINVVNPGNIATLQLIIDDQFRLLNKMREPNCDIQALSSKFYELDNYFHEQIYSRAGKLSVLKQLNSISPSFSRFRYLTFLREEKQIEELCYLHKKILNCIEEKDLVTLKGVVYSHNFSGIIGIEKVREKHPEFFE